MSIESATEQGLKTALKVYTDTLEGAQVVTYRCFFLDDETGFDEDIEERKYPLIEITASPNWPTKHKSPFRDIPVALKWATHRPSDPKKEVLVAMYAACRTIIDTETTILVSGYSFIAAIIDSGGESDVDENEQYITLPLTIKICGA